MGDTTTTVLAVVTGASGVMAAVGGVLLVIRKARTKEQQAAEAALAVTEGMLISERSKRIEAERLAYEAELILAQHGITPPPHEPD